MSDKQVYIAINAVMAELAKIGIAKEGKNTQQHYSFRGIDQVYNTLSRVLAEHKLLVLPRVLSRSVTERPSKGGGLLFYVVLEVEYDIVSAVDGSVHVVRTVGEAMDSADKATNKAMSAAYKYCMIQTFCIPVEGDEDADASTPEPRQKAEPKPQPGDDEPITEEQAKAVLFDVTKLDFNLKGVLDYFDVKNLIELNKGQLRRFNEIAAERRKSGAAVKELAKEDREPGQEG